MAGRSAARQGSTGLWSPAADRRSTPHMAHHQPAALPAPGNMPRPVLMQVGVAYGQLWTFERSKPHRWATVNLPIGHDERLLEPGMKVAFDSPDPIVGHGMIGPVVIFNDANGRRWQRTQTALVRLKPSIGRPRRWHAAF